MAPTSRRTGLGVIETLFEKPFRFDFFQAVRLLERLSRDPHGSDPRDRREPVGLDASPESEVVRFRAHLALAYPTSEILSVRRADGLAAGHSSAGSPPEMMVSFMGLAGPIGVLPDHYTTLLIARELEKDSALRAFLDLFNHRTISLFYRAWEKYRFPIAYERSKSQPNRSEDPFTQGVYSLVGLGTDRQRGRLDIPDEAFLYYAGLFVQHPRCATSLEALLGDYFDFPITVEQFQGQWLYLDAQDRSALPTVDRPEGRNSLMGIDFVIGERVWDAQSKCRLRIGPLGYESFRHLLPIGDALRAVCQLARMYVGPEFDFDVQLVLKADEAPPFRIGSELPDGPRLGWTSWSHSHDFTDDLGDVFFSLDDA